MSKTILVFGATGNQGGATVKALADINKSAPSPKYKILAVTRDATADKAKALTQLPGVELIQGGFENPAALFAQPVYGVFLAQPMSEKEIDDARAVIDAAANAKVQHFVYTGADLLGVEDTTVPWFETKRHIEGILKSSALPQWTILRPAGFMEMLLWDTFRAQVPLRFNPDMTWKFIAVQDIGRIAAQCFERPQEFVGKTLNIAGDAAKRDEIIKVWKGVTGKGMELDPASGRDADAELLDMFKGAFDRCFNKFEGDASPEETRELFPFVIDFRTWLSAIPAAYIS